MQPFIRSFLTLTSISAAAFLFSGCFGHSHTHTDGETPLEHACEHIAGTPTAVTAASTDAGSPDVSKPHTPYSVQLIDFKANKGGMVKFVADESTDFIIFLSSAIPLKVRDAAGGDIDIEETITSGIDCAGIKAYHTVPLTQGTSYLEFGPTSETQVKMVIEEGEHGH